TGSPCMAMARPCGEITIEPPLSGAPNGGTGLGLTKPPTPEWMLRGFFSVEGSGDGFSVARSDCARARTRAPWSTGESHAVRVGDRLASPQSMARAVAAAG